MGYLRIVGLVVIVAMVAACGGGEQAAPAEPAGAAGGTSAPAGKTVDAATAGAIMGKVMYAGEAKQGARIRMNADPTCSDQHSGPVFAQDLQVNDNGTLENAFVWVKSGLDGFTFSPPSGNVVLDQTGCVYMPHVLGVRTGQTLEIRNSDDTTHNINPSPQNNRNWNKSQAPKAASLTEVFAREEVMIPIKCNVHPWMKAYVGVISHPYFAVTGKDGSFELKGLPPGTYTVESWHERLGTSEMQVTVGASETKEADFSYDAQ